MTFSTEWFPPVASRPLKIAICGLFFAGYAGLLHEAWQRTSVPMIGWSEAPQRPTWLRVGVFQTDVWVESMADGTLRQEARFPITRSGKGLLDGAHFTPEAYLNDIRHWVGDRQGRCDVLMYYGGRRHGSERQGLNFNSWDATELQELHTLGGRPFIGLETMDPILVAEMAQALRDGGFRGSRLFIRIASEPSTSAYGTLDGTPHGKRHCAAAYAAYQTRFLQTARLLRRLGRASGIDFQIIFAGDSREDFDHYMPDPWTLDAIGYDLYITPANIRRVMPLLQNVLKRFPDRPIVIPEFGVATAGESHEIGYDGMRATPHWAESALAQALTLLGHHRGKVTQVTLFSVNVAERLPARRWSWVWTPTMLRMLEEWQHAPARWKAGGFRERLKKTPYASTDIL